MLMQQEKNQVPPSSNGNSKPSTRGRYGKTYRSIRLDDADDVLYVKSLIWRSLSEEDVIALLVKTCRQKNIVPSYPAEEANSEIANGSLSVTEPVS